MKRIVLTLLLTLTSLCSLNAAAAVQSVDSAVSPEKGRVGDPFTYTVTIRGTGLGKLKIVLPETKSYFPEPADKKKKLPDKTGDDENIPPLYTVKGAELVPGRDTVSETLTAKVIITYMKPGVYTLPEIKITGDDGVPIGYKLQAVTIIETNPEGAFEEIEGPMEPAADYKGIAFAVLSVIALLALAAAAGYYIYRYIKKRNESSASEIRVSVYEQFIIDLERLNPGELIAAGDVRNYAFGMSITFRRFISGRFGFDAAEMTTDEIRKSLKRFMPAELYSVHGDEIMRCMDLWDISKFAEFTPTSDMLTENLRSVKTVAEKVSVPEAGDVEPGV